MKSAFRGKWAFVVGGSEGIGFAIAKEIVKNEGQVLLIARTEAKLQKAVKELSVQASSDSKINYIASDAAEFEALKAQLQSKFDEGIHPTYLFNCAGRAIPDYFENISSQQVEENFRINVLTAWNAIQLCLPYLKAAPMAFIMNTSSVAGFVGVFGYTDYCISKFGLIGFTEALGSELERYNIQVSVLCPPDTDTPGFEADNLTKPEETKALSGNVSLMKPEAVAQSAIKQLLKGKKLILVGMESKFVVWVKRLFPGLLYRILQSDVKKVQKAQAK